MAAGRSLAAAQVPCIQWRPKAQDDLRAVVQSIAKAYPGPASSVSESGGLQESGPGLSDAMRPELARSFGQALRSQIDRLAQCPELGRTGRPGLPDDVRELVVHDDYIVFYRLLAQTGVIEILRIKPRVRHAP